LCIITR